MSANPHIQLSVAASAVTTIDDIPNTTDIHALGKAAKIRGRNGSRIPQEVIAASLRFTDTLAVTLICCAGLAATGTSLLAATVLQILPFIALIIVTLLALHVSGSWKLEARTSRLNHMLRTANGVGLMVLGCAMALIWIAEGSQARILINTGLSIWLALCVMHAAYILVVSRLSREGRLSENVVIVGATPNARRLIARNAETGELNIVGVFDDRLSRAPSEMEGVPVLGTLDDLLSWDALPDMDRIVVTVTTEARERVRGLIDRLRVLPQRVVLLLDLQGFDPETESLAEIADSPAAYVSGQPQNLRQVVTKRAADIVFSIGLFFTFLPVFLITALAIKLEDGGPIFFRQRRQGFNNQIVKVWKFRSMRPDKDAETCMSKQTCADDDRVTRIGRFIRATSIDELPQLLNVLRGEMSLVGPRPHAVGMTTEEADVHTLVSDYAHRHRVKPGLTGWAQINGSRGPVHTKEEVRERVRLDLEYVNRGSFWFDLYIMAATAPCLLGDRVRPR